MGVVGREDALTSNRGCVRGREEGSRSEEDAVEYVLVRAEVVPVLEEDFSLKVSDDFCDCSVLSAMVSHTRRVEIKITQWQCARTTERAKMSHWVRQVPSGERN